MTKKLLLFFVFATLFLNGCKESEDGNLILPSIKKPKIPNISSSAGPGLPMDSNDPNLDPNFKWYEPGVTCVYARETDKNTTNCRYISMPWFDGQSSLNQPGREDMLPEDGWNLIARDFGSADRTRQGVPFIILYNKYRGQLRLMYYNLYGERASHSKVTLSFENPNESAPYLTPMDPNIENKTVTTYNPNLKLSQLTEFDQTGGWAVADFHLGYVPSNYNNRNAILKFDLQLVNWTNTNGTEESETSGYMESAAGGSNTFVKIFEDGAKFAAGWAKITGLPFSGYSTAVNAVKGAFGLVDYFVGGKNKSTQKQSIQLSTTTNVDLTSEEVSGYGTILLSLFDDSWDNDGQTYKNLYSGNLGLANFHSPVELFIMGQYDITDDPEFPNGCAVNADLQLKFFRDQGTRFYINPDIINNVDSRGMTFGNRNLGIFKDRVLFDREVLVDELSSFRFYSGNKPTFGALDICVFDFIINNPSSQIMDNEYLALMTFPVVFEDYTTTENDCRSQQW